MDTAITANPAPTSPARATRVPPNHRSTLLPRYFGKRLMLRGETLVYDWLRRLCEQYRGAYWHFYELPGGGFYLAPDLTGKLLISSINGTEEELSPRCSGHCRHVVRAQSAGG